MRDNTLLLSQKFYIQYTIFLGICQAGGTQFIPHPRGGGGLLIFDKLIIISMIFSKKLNLWREKYRSENFQAVFFMFCQY
ncbi:MAG TPA: hypothetical protein DCO72_09230 [Ruminococcus sp.]|nr:hypothetical protein [Ruminococcus sp.]